MGRDLWELFQDPEDTKNWLSRYLLMIIIWYIFYANGMNIFVLYLALYLLSSMVLFTKRPSTILYRVLFFELPMNRCDSCTDWSILLRSNKSFIFFPNRGTPRGHKVSATIWPKGRFISFWISSGADSTCLTAQRWSCTEHVPRYWQDHECRGSKPLCRRCCRQIPRSW